MAAGRFRPPKSHTPARFFQPCAGCGIRSDVNYLFRREPDVFPVLRVSLTGIRNMPRKQQEALRKERKADPAGSGVHAWRRRCWITP